LRAAFELFELAEEIVEQNVLRENPRATEKEIARRIAQWRRHRPEFGAPDGALRLRPRS
jgi:hypothetical protein